MGQRLTTSGIFWILAFVRIIVWILCTVVRWLGLLAIDPNHHRCEKFNYNCQHMKHVTEQMKCGKELSNTTVCLDFLRRLSCVDIVCLCKTWPNKTNLIQLYKQTHLFVNMFQWCLSLQPIWSEPSASFTMSDEGAKASEVGKQHLFKWCIVVMHTARLPLKSQIIFLNKFSGNQAVPHRDETQSLILPWVLSLLCARLECTPDVWCIRIERNRFWCNFKNWKKCPR